MRHELGELPLIVCVTGPVAAGKNAAAEILARYGFVSADADILAHRAVEQSAARILEAFSAEAGARGIRLTAADGTVDRRALGNLVFSSPELLARQEAIVYPAFGKLLEAFLRENEGRDIAVNAAVLYKTPDFLRRCSKILYIRAPKLLRYLRARRRDRLPRSQIAARFRAQTGLLQKYEATGIPVLKISNTGSVRHLEAQLRRALNLRRSF